MVIVKGCRYKFDDYLENPFRPEYDPKGKYHLCNLCNEYDEQYFSGKHLETLFNIINQLNASLWLLSFTRELAQHNKESWNNPATMMGRVFSLFRDYNYYFNGSNTYCVIIRLKNEAIKHNRFG
jgi:hypothetical protein